MKVLVWLASTNSKARQIGKSLDRHCICHFEAELKIIGHCIHQFLQILATREIVIGGVHADGLEHSGVFTEAIPLETCLGNLAPILVARWRVELSKPALVFPR